MKPSLRQSLRLPGARETASRSAAAFAILLASLAMSWSASAEVLDSRYAVTFAGIPAGQAILHTTFNAKHYEVAVSADVGTVLDSTRIQGTASGLRSGVKLTPERFRLVLSGGEQGAIDVNFKGSGGTKATVNPRLKGVFDPLSALLLTSLKPISLPGNPCNHVLRIFTGRARFDLSLHPKPVEAAQTEPMIVVCQAEYAAVPGHFEKSDLEIVFTRLTKPRFWLVEHVSLPTPKGTVSIDRAETSISGS